MSVPMMRVPETVHLWDATLEGPACAATGPVKVQSRTEPEQVTCQLCLGVMRGEHSLGCAEVSTQCCALACARDYEELARAKHAEAKIEKNRLRRHGLLHDKWYFYGVARGLRMADAGGLEITSRSARARRAKGGA